MTSSYDGDEEDGYMAGQPAEYGSSFPGNQPLYGPEDGEHLASGFADDQKPKILLMGLRRSGKSSIQNVVFHKMSPNETLFLESTNKITTDDITNTSCVQFKILDFPGQIDFFDPSFDTEKIFGGVGALVFVIDAQDDYIDAVTRLGETVSRVYKINPKLKFEVFIHKVDGLTDDTKIEIQRDVHERASDDLQEAAADIPGLENVHLNSSLTSIYDHSIFEAFSKVVQKLIPQLPTLENLLNIFITNSGIEKAFLFDVSSKIYIATDYFSVDMQSYELCCDMIDIVLDISCIYGHEDDGSDHLAYFDSCSYSVIKLDNNTVLLLWQVARYLALVCILREENYDRPGLIEYNYQCFRKGLLEVFDVRNRYLQLEQRQVDQKVKQSQQVPGGKGRTSLDRGTTDGGGGSSSSASDEICPLPVRNRSSDDGGPHASTPIGGGVANLPDGDIATALSSRRLSGNTLLGASSEANFPNTGVWAPEPFQELGTKAHVLSGPVGGQNRRRSSGGFEGSGVAYRSNGVAGGVDLGGGLVSVTENDDWKNSGGAAGGKLRCASERRDRSDLRGSGLGAPLRPLLQGQVIRTGSRSSGPALVESAPPPAAPPLGGNTYIMTDDAGMVLLNGAAKAAGHS